MGRIYDLTNVEETQWINEVGTFTVKVISVKQDKTNNGNAVEKVTFADKFNAQISDEFVVTDKALWKMKIFSKALKLPTVTDTDTWIGRYVVIHTAKETYIKNDGTQGEKIVIKWYEASNLTNTVPVEVKKPVEVEDEYNPFG